MNKINWTDARIGDSALVTSENKMGVILKDYGRKFHLRFADGSEKTYDASELNFFNTDDDYKRGGSIKKGDVYQWNTVEYDSKKGNNYKVVKNIEITDIDSKGQVIGRVVGTSNKFIIRDPQKNLKSKVSKMETGGNIDEAISKLESVTSQQKNTIKRIVSTIERANGKQTISILNIRKGHVILNIFNVRDKVNVITTTTFCDVEINTKGNITKGFYNYLTPKVETKYPYMEKGGDIERGGAHMYIELKDSDIVVYHGDAFKIYKNAKPMFVISSAKKGSWDELWQSIRSIQSSNTDGEKGSAHIYVKLSNGDITVYHGDNVRQFRKLDEDERLFLQKNVRKDSWDRVYNTLMNLKSVKMENGGGIDAIQVGDYVHINQSAAKISEDLGNYVIITSVIGRNIQGKNYPYMFKVSKNKLMPHSSGKGWKVEGKINPIKPQMFDDRKMQDGGVVGQEIVFDDSGERNTGVIKEIHEITGDYIVATDDGRTVLAQKEFDVISLGKMRKQAEAKRRFSFFENGGSIGNINLDEGMKSDVKYASDYFGVGDFDENETGISQEEFEEVVDSSDTIKDLIRNLNETFDLDSKEAIYDILNLSSQKMSDGGNIAKENKEMIDSQTIEARHHVEELSKILTKKNKIEPWVVARMERATTDLSDVTHYLEGKKMAKGGGVGDESDEDEIDFNSISSLQQELGRLRRWANSSGSKGADAKIKQLEQRIEYLKYNTKMAQGGGVDDDFVIFSIDDDALDTLLFDNHRSELDYEDINGDSYYKLNRRDFDRFIDYANSIGFDVDYENNEDAVVYVVNPRMAKGGGVRKAPFKVGDMVYSYQNPNHKMRISFVEDRGVIDGVDYGWGIKVALKTDSEGNYDPKGTYSKSSKWMSQNSVSKVKKEKYAKGGGVGDRNNLTLMDSCTITVEGNIKTQPKDVDRWSDSYEPVYQNDLIELRVYESALRVGAYDITIMSRNKYWWEFTPRDMRKRSKPYVNELRSQITSLLKQDGIKLKSLKMMSNRVSMETGGGVGSKLKATYIPNRNIDELKTVFGQSIKGKDLIDGAYTTRKGIKQKPKMARTMFEEETYEFSKGGGVKNFELDKRLAEITLKVLESKNLPFGEEVYMNLMDRDLIKSMYGERLPRGFAGPTSFMLIGAVLNPLTGKSVYMDGSQLIVGNDAVMTIKYGITTWKDVIEKLHLQSSKMSTGGAVKKNGVNQFAEDERADGYDAKVFLGHFDGKKTFKAQFTDKTWPDGTPVTKYFSRNGFKDVKLKGEYQLVDSDRGWWYIQGPRNVWYAVRHKDYGTPPFEFGKGGMMPGWKHKMAKGGGVDPTEAEAEAQKLMDELGVMVVPDPQNYGNQIRLNIYPNSNPGDRFYDGRAAQRFTVAVDNGKYLFSNGGGYRRSIQPIALLFGVEVNDNTGVAGRSSIDMSLNKKPVSLNTIRMISNYFKQGLKDESNAFSNFYKNWSNPD